MKALAGLVANLVNALARARSSRSAATTLYAIALAVISGVLYALAFSPNDLWPFAFVAYVPILFALRGQSPRRSFWLGVAMGATSSALGFSWLVSTFREYLQIPYLAAFALTVGICLYQGLSSGLHGWLYARAAARGWPSPLAFLAAFSASELVLPMLFPWHFGATVHRVPLLLQTAELGGPIAVGLFLVCCNLLVAALAEGRPEERYWVKGLALVAGGAVAFGAWRMRVVDAWATASEAATVGVVQANAGVEDKDKGIASGVPIARTLTGELRAKGAQFVVWSETIFAAPRPEEEWSLPSPIPGWDLQIPSVVGANVAHVDQRYRVSLFNSAIAVDATGKALGRYDKRLLLPFAEYVPFGDKFPVLRSLFPESARFDAGTRTEALRVTTSGQSHRVAALICYEDIVPQHANTVIHDARPELLVTMTSDTLFGNTGEPWQHFALAKFRAVEHRRFLVRSSNSGPSGIVDPNGRVLVQTAPFVVASAIGSVRWMNGEATVYERLGDRPAQLFSLFSIVTAFVRFPRRKVVRVTGQPARA